MWQPVQRAAARKEPSCSCRYNSLWALACSTVLFHASLSIAVLLQFWSFIFPRSALIASSHLNLGLPILTTTGIHPVTLSTVLPLSILTTCQKVTLQCIYFGFFLTSNKNSPDLIVLLSHCFSTTFPPQLKHSAHRWTSFSVPSWYEKVFCVNSHRVTTVSTSQIIARWQIYLT